MEALFTRRNIFFLLTLVVLVWGVFGPCLSFDFVNWDDPDSVTANPDVSQPSLRNIFTHFVNGNYQPLTTLSYALEYRVFGLSSKVSHATNIALHALNGALVYCFIFLLTRRAATALAVALLFAIHPLRVESVAWATERKDVLFAFFYLSGLIIYLKNISRSFKCWFTRVFFLFILSALAKPSAVSFPLALLTIDFYLNRLGKGVFREKIPFLLTSVAFGCLALYGNFMTPFLETNPVAHSFSIVQRLGLVAYAILFYLSKLAWPFHLSCFYPFPESVAVSWTVVGFVFAVFLGVCSRRNRLVGWGVVFFLVTIVFNLPIFSVGHVVAADRFTYLPSIGVFLIVVTFLSNCFDRIRKNNFARMIFAMIIGLIAVALAAQTYLRCRVWKNSDSLWTDVIGNYPQIPMAHYNRGNYFADQGKPVRAYEDYSQAILLAPDYFAAINNRGNMSLLLGNVEEALADYDKAITISPSYIPPYLNKAAYFEYRGDLASAIEIYGRILKIDPSHAQALQQKELLVEKLNKTNRIQQ